MDMRNVAVGVVMEVIATTMVPLVTEEETTSPTLVHDNIAIVLDCPHTGSPAEPCVPPMSWDIGVSSGNAIAA